MKEKRTSIFENGLIWFGAGLPVQHLHRLDSRKVFWQSLSVTLSDVPCYSWQV